jgi:hypothetical protein
VQNQAYFSSLWTLTNRCCTAAWPGLPPRFAAAPKLCVGWYENFVAHSFNDKLYFRICKLLLCERKR